MQGKYILVVAGLLGLWLWACGTELPTAEVGPQFPIPRSQWRQVIPGAEVPADVTTYASNNNLDIVVYEGSLYVAFRTASSHFAGTDTLIHVLRTDDIEGLTNWKLEKTYFTGEDLREPRMFVHDGHLYLYISELGSNITTFEPGRVFGMRRDTEGHWTEPRDIFTDGEIVWRTKTLGGRAYMTGYRGGEDIYQGRAESKGIELLFLTTEDGWTWRGVDPSRPTVLLSGGSESDFEFDRTGDLYAVVRNEAGDASGFGSKLCRAESDNLGVWHCNAKSDPHKYDSPYMFSFGDFMYLIARYNPNGVYDRNTDEPDIYHRFLRNEIRYSTTAKRTALYGYDTQNMQVLPLDIFPSSGDTAFASGVWLDDHRHLVFNYSSDPNVPDMTWIEGQFRGSQIYAAVLDFSKP